MTLAAPLKIFHINMHHHWGGQPNRILTESKGLAELGHEVWIAGPKGCLLCQRAKEAGLKIFDDLELRRGFRPLSMWKDYAALRRLFEREKFDIVHPHGSQDTWVSVFAARGVSPRPAIVRTRHNTFAIATHPLNRWLYRQMDFVITIAPQVDELVSKDGLFPPDRIRAIYSAPDPDRFFPRVGSAEMRKSLGIPEGAPVVGMVARLAPEKGHHLLVGAAARVVKEFPEARFLLVGKGRSQPDIEKQIRELGLEKNFVLAGFRTDVPDLVALMDIFTLTPTSGESLGTSILEAFCMEKPVVATQVGGTGESVRDGVTGFLIKPASEEEQVAGIAEALLKLLRDPDQRIRFGAAGRAMVLEEFSPRNLAMKCAEIYQGLQSSRKP